MEDVLILNEKMFGSIHTHFEDLYDTANNLKEMVKKFNEYGAKKVALTGHGSLFAYEDLKEIVASLKASDEISQDFEIIPGCEVYFEDEARHMVLVAKNYEGYKDLCKIVTASAKNTKVTSNTSEEIEYLTPLVTMENLKNNVRKGNLFMSTACIGGVFGQSLGLIECKLSEAVDKEQVKYEKILEKDMSEQHAIVSEYIAKKEDPSSKKPTKAEYTKANRLANKEGDFSMLDALQEREVTAAEYAIWKKNHQPAYEDARKKIKKFEENVQKGANKVQEAQDKLTEYQNTFSQRWEKAKNEYAQFEDIFGKENIYFELQNHGLFSEKIVFNNIVQLAYAVGNPHFVASNDIHIGDTKGSETWENSVIRRRVEKFNRYKSIDTREDEEEYGIKSDVELKEALLNIIEDCYDANGVLLGKKEDIVNEAVSNIKTSLENCSVKFPKISIDGINHYPKYCENENDVFEAEVRKGIAKRFPNGFPSEEYAKRLDYEIDIIKSMGYAGYHLIVKDYLEYARLLGFLRTQEEIDNAPLSIEELDKYIDDNNIPRVGMGIGPGRGSAAGSLCCFGLGITDIDPIPHGLLFERFLNPSRQSMPDIDSDFKEDIRDRCYEYIKKKFGEACVAKICTKAYAYGKAAVGISQRYLTTEKQGLLDDKIQKKEIEKRLLSCKDALSKKIEKTVETEGLSSIKVEDGTKALKLMIDRGELSGDELEIAELAVKISGIPSNISMHAGGVLISGSPLYDVMPLAWNNAKKVMTTQCLYPQAEELGVLKMDLLNIKNLGVITKVMQSNENPALRDNRLNNPKEIEKILMDSSIYSDIYSKGLTQGVFQVESPGMTNMMKDFNPTKFEDIILLLAAYRPGPMDFIPEIIATKKYLEDPIKNPKPKKAININNEILNKILAPTYGVPIYQEQVMQIFQHLAGYSMADADNVRRFMSKKKEAALAKEKPAFIYGDESRGIPGCMAAGLTEQEASDLFDKLKEFSKYAFNKSHALCYAQVSMYTAYQKKYHPALFYKHSLSNETRDVNVNKTIDKYFPELKFQNIKLLPPSIARSKEDYSVEACPGYKFAIRMGFGNIKGHSYEQYVPGNSIHEFIINNPSVSLAVVEDFIKLGMFNACWRIRDHEKEVTRVNKNRTVMLKWLGENGEDIKKTAELYRESLQLRTETDEIDRKIKHCSNKEEYELLCKELDEKKQKRYEIRDAVDEINSSLKDKKNIDYKDDKICPEESIEETVEYREFELDKLGMVFNVESSLKKIRNCGSKKGFDTLYLPENYNEKVQIPASIISCHERVSKNNTPYYILKLMDRNEELLEVRSFHKPTVTDGYFAIKYSVNESGYKNVVCHYEKPFENKNISAAKITKDNINDVTPSIAVLPDGRPALFGTIKENEEALPREVLDQYEEKEIE